MSGCASFSFVHLIWTEETKDTTALKGNVDSEAPAREQRKTEVVWTAITKGSHFYIKKKTV